MTTPASATSRQVPGDKRRVFLWNFVTVVLTGTAICVWAGYYSDKLPEITALLGGGGALVWVMTAFSLLREKSQQQFLSWMETTIFSCKAFTGFLVVAVVGSVAAGNFLGSVQVETVAEEGEHSVVVYPLGSQAPSNAERLDPSQPLRSVVWTSWFNPKPVVVKIPGYPRRIVTVAPFHRVNVLVPASLRTPVLLFRPTQVLADVLKGASMKLELTDERGTPLAPPAAFDGAALLSGGEDDINLPPEFEEKWRNEVPKRIDLLNEWRTPIAPTEFATLRLTQQQVILARVLLNNGKPYDPHSPPTKIVISSLRANRPFVQEVVLYESH